MSSQTGIDEYLARAREAEEQARKSAEASARESWLRIAGAYRQMAKHRLGEVAPVT